MPIFYRYRAYILAVPSTVGDVGQDRTDVMRPSRPLKLDSAAGSYASRDIGIYCIFVADDVWISVLN
jgi:hypothetical protein